MQKNRKAAGAAVACALLLLSPLSVSAQAAPNHLDTAAITHTAVAAANSEIKVTVNGTPVQFTGQKPVIISGRTFVPVRNVLEKMGKKVDWDGKLRQVTVSDDLITIKLVLDSKLIHIDITDPVTKQVFVDEHNMEVAPTIINGSTCLPIRPVVEGFGNSVDWDGNTRTVIIDTNATTC